VPEVSSTLESELLRHFSESLDLFCIAGFDGYFKHVNPAFERVLGYSKAELLNRPFLEISHADDLRAAKEAVAGLERGRDLVGFVARAHCADGSVRWIEWNTSTRPEQGVFYGVGRDITDRVVANAEMEALRRIATLTAEGANPERLFGVVAEEVGRVIGVPLVSVARFEGDGTATECASYSPAGPAFPIGSRWSLDGTNVLRLVRDSCRPARIDDHSQLQGQIADLVRAAGIYSTVAIPIVVAGQVWGAMVVSSTDRVPLPSNTEERLADFTELLATSIASAESREALRRFAEEQIALRRLAMLVAQGASPDAVFAGVSDEVGRLFGSDAAWVVKFEEIGPPLLMVGAGKGTGRFGVGTRWEHDDLFPSTRVFRTGRPVRVGRTEVEAHSGPMAEVLRRERLAGTVACPIVVDGRLWGAIAVSTREEVVPIDAEERLEKFTELVATAISNAHAGSELARVAEEQAALRRVATLIANDIPPADLFVAVAEEVGRVFGTGLSTAVRFEHDLPAAVMVGATEAVLHWFPVGTKVVLEGPMPSAEVYRSGRSARMDARDWSVLTGPVAETGRNLDITSTVACPINVEGRLWGAMMVSDAGGALLPPNTEERLQKFTELMATAISNIEARAEVERLAEEQAALRRMATLVAERAKAAEIFSAVCTEVGALFDVETAAVVRFEADPPSIRVVGVGPGLPGIEVGTLWQLDDALASTEVYRTGRSARIDNRDLHTAVGPIHEPGRRLGLTCTVAAPILVDGNVWGTVSVSSSEPPASDAESKLERFGDLVATAIANAESRAQLAASRRRIVAASDETRRRIERDLHDGMQQRLVSLALVLRAAERIVPPGSADLKSEVAAVAAGLTEAVDELREISSGIHPAIMSQGGLSAALRTLARRSSLPVALDVADDLRAEDQIEVAAYFVASEALTNSTKHAHASELALSLRQQDGALLLCVRDNGVGGADPTGGSGLTGLSDRVEALGGSIRIESPAGEGTTVSVRLPLEPVADDPALPTSR